jgi:hypothetical protein
LTVTPLPWNEGDIKADTHWLAPWHQVQLSSFLMICLAMQSGFLVFLCSEHRLCASGGSIITSCVAIGYKSASGLIPAQGGCDRFAQQLAQQLRCKAPDDALTIGHMVARVAPGRAKQGFITQILNAGV